MSRIIPIVRDPYYQKDYIFTQNKVEFYPGITILTGANGTGKTTLLNLIKKECELQKVPVYFFSNYQSGGSNAQDHYLLSQQFNFLATSLVSSEGEEIILSMNNQAKKIGTFIRDKGEAGEEIWILLDAMDSGLSIDNILDLKDFFRNILEYEKDKEVFFIVSANSYEMAKGENCLDVKHLKTVSFADYDDYRKYILRSSKEKKERYHKEEIKRKNRQLPTP